MSQQSASMMSKICPCCFANNTKDEDVAYGKNTLNDPLVNGKDQKKDDKEKQAFHKKLYMDRVQIEDIDDTFREFTNAVNPFIASREKIQTARESFEKVVHTLCDFNPENEIKVYMNQLKKKAKLDQIRIYIEVINDQFIINVSSSRGIDPPKQYKEAAKTLTAIKSAIDEFVDLEPDVRKGITQTATEMSQISPESDLRQHLTSTREILKLPGMISKFKKNLQKVKETPAIITEYVTYVKQLLSDILEALNEDIPTSE